MANPNDWSQFYNYNNNNNNQPFFTTSATASTAVTTTVTTGEAATTSVETGRVTKPARRRSRASRRTPTTLLNTDTSNFRAMVQQFTGGPSAMAFGSGHTPSGFSLTSAPDPSAGSSSFMGQQQLNPPWQYSFQPHASTSLPQRPYMLNPVVGYGNVNNPTDVFGTTEGGGGGGGGGGGYPPSSNSNTSPSRPQ